MKVSPASLSPRKKLGVSLCTLLLLVAGVLLFTRPVSAIQLLNRTLKLSSSIAGLQTTYTVGFQHQSTVPIGSVRVQFCANDPLIGQPCTAPAGLSLSGASLASQIGMTGFTIHPSTTANVLVLTRTPSASPAQVVASFELTNVVNPSVAGTYFARLESFSSTDASGTHVDYGGVAFNINRDLTIQATVPPFLLFCTGLTISNYDCGTATGNYIDFGTFSSAQTSSKTMQFLVATNAEYGYAVRVSGPTLTSGVNTIPGLSNPDVSRKGVSQFGLNLRGNTTPTVGSEIEGSGSANGTSGYVSPNYYKFVDGDTIASSTTTDSYRLYTVSYIVNVASDQRPGIYVTTLTYTALASF